MEIKHYKPATNDSRGMTTLQNKEITFNNNLTNSLIKKVSKAGERNNQGKKKFVTLVEELLKNTLLLTSKETNLVLMEVL